MPARLVVRAAAPDDAVGIAVVHVESWRAAYRGLLPQSLLDGLSVDRRAETWRCALATRDGRTLVGADVATGMIVGFVNAGPSRDDDAAGRVGEVRAIYLLRGWWDAGVGRQLHDAGIDLLRLQFREATLWVLECNDRARRFYERLGWELDGATKSEHRGEAVLAAIRYRRSLVDDTSRPPSPAEVR